MRGRQREFGGYHAQRGWFYGAVQTVIRHWTPRLGLPIVLETFDSVWRAIEEGEGVISVRTYGVEHRKFLCQLIAALDKLHDPDRAAGWVVKQCGHAQRPTLLRGRDIIGFESLVAKLHQNQDPVSKFLSPRLPQTAIRFARDPRRATETRQDELAKSLNEILKAELIYDKRRFAHVHLRPETRRRLKLRPIGVERISLNRLLLEDAFPSEIRKSEFGNARHPFSYEDMAMEIVAHGGPQFKPGDLSKAAKRLKLTGPSGKSEKSIFTCF